MRMAILLIGLMLALSACTLRRVEISVPGDEVVVKEETHHHHHHHSEPPRFCPPGHRMKGWC